MTEPKPIMGVKRAHSKYEKRLLIIQQIAEFKKIEKSVMDQIGDASPGLLLTYGRNILEFIASYSGGWLAPALLLSAKIISYYAKDIKVEEKAPLKPKAKK